MHAWRASRMTTTLCASSLAAGRRLVPPPHMPSQSVGWLWHGSQVRNEWIIGKLGEMLSAMAARDGAAVATLDEAKVTALAAELVASIDSQAFMTDPQARRGGHTPTHAYEQTGRHKHARTNKRTHSSNKSTHTCPAYALSFPPPFSLLSALF